MQEAGRPVLVGTVRVEKSEMLPRCSSGAASSTRCSTPSSTRRSRGSSPRPAAPARSRSPRTWPAAARTSCSVATRPASRRRRSQTRHRKPRHRHPPRRQPGRPRLGAAPQAGLNPAEVDAATYDAALAEAKAITEEDHDEGRRGRRPAHHRHRAPRRAAHRQPAPRPRRPPGRPGLVALLPLARRRPHEALRLATGSPGSWSGSASRTTSPSSRASCRKTIESAQTRVEGFNFDIRKRVVEYDDVINKQRETIYAERDKVLHNEDLTETVRAFLDDEIDVLVDTHLAGEDPRRLEPRGPVERARTRWA